MIRRDLADDVTIASSASEIRRPGIMIAAGKAVGNAVGRALSRGKSKEEEEDRAAAMREKRAHEADNAARCNNRRKGEEMEHKIEDALKSEANGARANERGSIASALALVPERAGSARRARQGWKHASVAGHARERAVRLDEEAAQHAKEEADEAEAIARPRCARSSQAEKRIRLFPTDGLASSVYDKAKKKAEKAASLAKSMRSVSARGARVAATTTARVLNAVRNLGAIAFKANKSIALDLFGALLHGLAPAIRTGIGEDARRAQREGRHTPRPRAACIRCTCCGHRSTSRAAATRPVWITRSWRSRVHQDDKDKQSGTSSMSKARGRLWESGQRAGAAAGHRIRATR